MTKFNNTLFKWLEGFITILLYVLTAVAFFHLMSRFLLRWSNAGIDELTRLAFVWVVSIGSAMAFRSRSHVGITYLANKLSSKNRVYLELLVRVILICFMLAVIKAGIEMTTMGASQYSTYLELPMSFFYACIPFGAALSILVFIEDINIFRDNLKEVLE